MGAEPCLPVAMSRTTGEPRVSGRGPLPTQQVARSDKADDSLGREAEW